jgi:mRNA interferase MazF
LGRRMARELRRGDVRWFHFERPDKRRPVLLLTRDSALPYLDDVTVAPISTRIREIPSEVPLSVAEGMPRECAVNLDHVQTVPKGRLGPLVARLSGEKLRAVGEALGFALDV